MLEAIAKLLKVLNSETDPNQISLAFAFAMIAGLTPLLSLHNLLVLLLILILRVNLSAFILGLSLFSGIAYLLDPLFHSIGLTVLKKESLETLWSSMYNSSFWMLAQFNNSVVMGSLLFSLILFIPLHFLTKIAINRYRDNVYTWVQKTRLMQVLQASKFYSIYQSISG